MLLSFSLLVGKADGVKDCISVKVNNAVPNQGAVLRAGVRLRKGRYQPLYGSDIMSN